MKSAEGVIDSYEICESMISNLGFYPHQLGGFEYLLSDLLPKIISEHTPVQVVDAKNMKMHRVHFKNLRYCRPSAELYPGEIVNLKGTQLHNHKMTLQTEVRVDVVHEIYDKIMSGSSIESEEVTQIKSRKIFENFALLDLPIMDGLSLTNDFDNLDPILHDRYDGTMCVNGHRKTVIIQTRLRCNFPFVKAGNVNARHSFQCEIRSSHALKMRSSSTLKIFLMKSRHGDDVARIICQIPYVPKKIPITILFRALGVKTRKEMIGLIVEGRAQKSATLRQGARQLIEKCAGKSVLDTLAIQSTVTATFTPTSTEEELVLEYIATTLDGAKACGSAATIATRTTAAHATSIRKLLSVEVLPHLGEVYTQEILHKKATYLGVAVRKLLLVRSGDQMADDEDEIEHRRYSTSGQTIAMKLRQMIRQTTCMLAASMSRCFEHSKTIHIPDILKADAIGRPIRSCLARGNFAVSTSQSSAQNGVCQVLNSMNRISRIAHMTTVNKPVSRDGSHSEARQLKPSAWGIICAAHTPDGRSIGLVSHHTLLFDIRRGHPRDQLIEIIKTIRQVKPLDRNSRTHPTVVNVDYESVGRTKNASSLLTVLNKMRTCFVLPKDICISFDRALNLITIHGEEGDAIRPVLLCSKLPLVKDMVRRFSHFTPHLLYRMLLSCGALIHINKAEEAMYRIASRVQDLDDSTPLKFSHIEIDPTIALFGTTIGLLPFLSCNQGPRNVYFGAMAPQAIGAEHPLARDCHVDVISHTLMYPQRPLTRTLTSRLVEGDDCDESIYQLYNVAILPYNGKNEEDAILMNRSSIQRGLGMSLKHSIIRDSEAELVSGDREYFCLPDEFMKTKQQLGRLVGRKMANYDALDKATGLPRRGTLIKPGQIVIGKVLIAKFVRSTGATSRVIDKSTVWRGNTTVQVDQVTIVRRGAVSSAIVRLTEMHSLESGDKLASCGSQKGVVSDTVNQEDLPFTKDGIIPDLMFSPHGITSRMTIGGVREFVSNYLAVTSGVIFDGTAFRPTNITILDDVARQGACEHEFMCGITGRKIGKGFMFVVSYTLQRHQAASKVHARATGPRNAITQQAVEGRSNMGGLKLGSMEVSAIASVGAAQTLRDSMTDFDGRKVLLCEKCGEPSPEACKRCGASPVEVFIPRVTLALMWELKSCGISMRLRPSSDKTQQLTLSTR